MTNYKSPVTPVSAKDSEVFGFLSDFRNLEGLMPPQVANWEATNDTCSFTLQNLASLEMRMESNTPFSNVKVASFGTNPVDYTLNYHIKKVDLKNCTVMVDFCADLNPFMKMVAAQPLQNLVNLMAQKLQDVFKKS